MVVLILPYSMKDLKYLAAYINPLIALAGFFLGGIATYGNVIFVFVLVPIFDYLGPNSAENIDLEDIEHSKKNKIFDWLLYLNVPILYGVLFFFVRTLEFQNLSPFEIVGNILSMGIVIGTCGINVAHELGHRKSKIERVLAQVLLIPALYMHFFIEHNRGHHKNVATKLDPASAEKGESLYVFWFKSIIGGYRNAWKLENERFVKNNEQSQILKNKMVVFSAVELVYLTVLVFLISWQTFLAVVFAGIIGVLLLETINYIEHYGLRRKFLDSNRYERVLPKHSWNANYHFGRIVLYELTRHSDHHYLASKKYQILDHHENSPQLPFGYPLMMLIAFVPPLWYKIVDSKIPQNKISM